MGLFDFMKDAGEDITAPVEVSPERLDELRTKSIAAKVAELDVEGEQVSVQVKGDNAVLTGTAPSQEALEKIVLCAGNQFGIATVDCQLQVDAPAAAEAAPAAAAGAGHPQRSSPPAHELGLDVVEHRLLRGWVAGGRLQLREHHQVVDHLAFAPAGRSEQRGRDIGAERGRSRRRHGCPYRENPRWYGNETVSLTVATRPGFT